MADLRFENPATTEGFVRSMADLDTALPLRLCDEHVGSVIDHNGMEVFVVDQNGELSDALAVARAELIVLAVNTCGGFTADRSDG